MEFKSHQDDEDAATADRNAYANELDDTTAELKLREQELKTITENTQFSKARYRCMLTTASS